jgi:hypothetical protein
VWGAVLRCGEVRGSPKILVRASAIGAEGHAGEGPLRGWWRPASGSWQSGGGGGGPRAEVPVP